MSKEIWKEIPGYEGVHWVSDRGRIWTVFRWVAMFNGARCKYGGFRKPGGKKKSYLWIELDRFSRGRPVHRIVWEAFRGPIPEGKEINHRNGKKRDNRISNLEVVTHSENMKHAYDNGLIPSRKGEGNTKAKLTEKQVRKIREEFGKGGVSLASLSRKYFVTTATISAVVRRESWSHLS